MGGAGDLGGGTLTGGLGALVRVAQAAAGPRQLGVPLAFGGLGGATGRSRPSVSRESDDAGPLSKILNDLGLRGYMPSPPPQPARGAFDYLEPRRGDVVTSLPAAPSRDHYRLVPTREAAQDALLAGEFPVVVSPDVMSLDPRQRAQELERLRRAQWEGPGAIFFRLGPGADAPAAFLPPSADPLMDWLRDRLQGVEETGR